jgi:uncharacterized protein (DUF2461 family)
MNHAFEQHPKESAKAFAAFSLYLNLGAERSLAAVAQKLSKSEQLLKRWSAKFDWPARVGAAASPARSLAAECQTNLDLSVSPGSFRVATLAKTGRSHGYCRVLPGRSRAGYC